MTCAALRLHMTFFSTVPLAVCSSWTISLTMRESTRAVEAVIDGDVKSDSGETDSPTIPFRAKLKRPEVI